MPDNLFKMLVLDETFDMLWSHFFWRSVLFNCHHYIDLTILNKCLKHKSKIKYTFIYQDTNCQIKIWSCSIHTEPNSGQLLTMARWLKCQQGLKQFARKSCPHNTFVFMVILLLSTLPAFSFNWRSKANVCCMLHKPICF